MSVSSLLATIRLHREVARQELQIVPLVPGVVTHLVQLVIGIFLVISPGHRSRWHGGPTVQAGRLGRWQPRLAVR